LHATGAHSASQASPPARQQFSITGGLRGTGIVGGYMGAFDGRATRDTLPLAGHLPSSQEGQHLDRLSRPRMGIKEVDEGNLDR